MARSIVRFRNQADGGAPRWGEMKGEHVFPLGGNWQTTAELIAAGELSADTRPAGLLSELEVLAPVTRDGRLYCQGLNYSEHRAESGVRETNDGDGLFFLKDSGSLCGPRDPIFRPPGVQLLDYEIELGLVLRKDINSPVALRREDLSAHVAGLVICNDISARDQMFGAPMMQWFLGKSARNFCPCGPTLLLLEDGDVDLIFDLQLELRLNGEVRQRAHTSQLMHLPHDAISALSRHVALRSGDCLLTGTPGGVLAQASPESFLAIRDNLMDDDARRAAFVTAQRANGAFLNPGDLLELTIRSPDGAIDLGAQRNVVEAQQILQEQTA